MNRGYLWRMPRNDSLCIYQSRWHAHVARWRACQVHSRYSMTSILSILTMLDGEYVEHAHDTRQWVYWARPIHYISMYDVSTLRSIVLNNSLLLDYLILGLSSCCDFSPYSSVLYSLYWDKSLNQHSLEDFIFLSFRSSSNIEHSVRINTANRPTSYIFASDGLNKEKPNLLLEFWDQRSKFEV